MATSSGKKHSTPSRAEILEQISGASLNGHPGIQILSTDCSIEPHGRVDAMAVDAAGRAILVQFVPKSADAFFMAVVDSAAWLEQHQDLLIERFQSFALIPELPPLIVLIAEKFEAILISRLNALKGVDLQLLEARYLELAGEKRISLKPVFLPRQEKGRHGEFIPSWVLKPATSNLLQLALNKIRKISSDIEFDWGPQRLDILYQDKLLALLVVCSDGLRLVIPGIEPKDSLVQNESQCVRQLDLIMRRYLSISLEMEIEAPRAEIGEKKIPKENVPVLLPARRQFLSAEELEAFTE